MDNLYMYIGTPGSLGYIKGKVYKITKYIKDGYIWVRCKGHVDCPYGSVESMERNWKKL